MTEGMHQGGEKKPTREEIIKTYWSREAVEDTANDFIAIRLASVFPELWPKIVPALTYEEFIKNELSKNKLPLETAEAIIAASDASFIEKFDAFAGEINAAMGEGIASEGQAKAVSEIATRAEAFIREYYRRTWPE